MKNIAENEDYVKTKKLNKALGQEIIGVRARLETTNNHIMDAWDAEERLERIIDKCPLCRLRRRWSRR